MPRVLILTASIGEGHDLPARTLTDQLRAERPDAEVVVEDGLAAMGKVFELIGVRGAGFAFYRFQWLWDLAFWVFAGFAPTRRATQGIIRRAGSRGVLRLVARVDPDVVVSTYPATTEALGWLRRTGRLDVPACAAITDLAMMHYWAARGIDLHLVTHPESIAEVRAVAGADTDVRAVHGLTRPEFVRPRDRADARVSLGLPPTGKVVLVSGGGWGVGDLESAIDAALAIGGVAAVVCLCGHNDELRARIDARFAGDPRVRAEGFTEQMGDWLAAGDALVHSTAGLTALEAQMRGCPTISYGWGRGHIRANNAAFRRFGLADVAATRPELADSLRRALAARPAPDLSFGALPSAASVVLSLLS
jgi:processive 1,2-diacylglycerol beta-glucosyltransferase